MHTPNGYTEQQIIEMIEKIGKILGSLYAFSFYTAEDIKQEVWVMSLEAIKSEKYDGKRKLENFLFIHCRNRVLNLLRDKYYKSQCPCNHCLKGNKHEDGNHCKVFINWQKRNSDKTNLANLSGNIDDEQHIYEDNSVENNELVDHIDAQLSPELREIYLKMKAGEKVHHSQIAKIKKALESIWKKIK